MINRLCMVFNLRNILEKYYLKILNHFMRRQKILKKNWNGLDIDPALEKMIYKAWWLIIDICQKVWGNGIFPLSVTVFIPNGLPLFIKACEGDYTIKSFSSFCGKGESSELILKLHLQVNLVQSSKFWIA